MTQNWSCSSQIAVKKISTVCVGRSINKELLVEPDLTNQIIGILIRFRQGKVAFFAHIEKMFFQVLSSKEHRSLLCFLWWQDGNLSRT